MSTEFPNSHRTSVHLSIALISLCIALVTAASVTPAQAQGRRGPQGKAEVLPMEKAAPMPVVVDRTGPEAELRAELRTRTAVSPLGNPTSKFSEAPVNSYGFIPAQPLSLSLVMRSPDLMIEKTPSVPASFEIHKLDDGGGLVVGFVSKEMLAQLTPAQRLHPITVSLYTNPSDKAPYIVAVPLVKLVADRMPTKADPARADSAIVLTVDLQGTANRNKSLHGGQ
ncbi:MAG: hypothetical protein U0172_06455 [Nitrospiraceae bacterium]